MNSIYIIGKPADDDVKLGALKLKPNTKIMMMGTREESLVNNLLISLKKWEKCSSPHYDFEFSSNHWKNSTIDFSCFSAECR